MSENGPSISEIRSPLPRDHSSMHDPDQGHETPMQPGNKPTGQNKWAERLKNIGLQIFSEEPFRPEDFTERAVAKRMLALATHPERERLGHAPSEYMFTRRDYLSSTGHMRDRNNPNSPAYRFTGQAFNALARDGRIETFEFETPRHGETQGYYIADESVDELKKFSESPEEE